MGSGPTFDDDAEGTAHDALTCRPAWTRHGRFFAWKLHLAGEAARAEELPEQAAGGGEPALVGEDDLAHATMPLWTDGIDEDVALVTLGEEDLDRIFRHRGAAAIEQVVFEAVRHLRDLMRERFLEVVADGDDGGERVEDEWTMAPFDDIVVMWSARHDRVRLPRHLLDDLYACELEPRRQETVAWPRVILEAIARHADGLDERAGAEVPYQPSAPPPCFRARAPDANLPSVEERSRWLRAELFARVFPGSRRCSG